MPGVPGVDHEPCGTSGIGAGWRTVRGEHLLSALSRVSAASMVLLATVATIIASQAVITGALSMTRQAIQLGFLPRLQIIQTSAEGYGQVYLPAVNYQAHARDACTCNWLRKLDRPRRCLWNRGVGGNVGDYLSLVYCSARDLELAPADCDRDRRWLCHGRRRISFRQYDERRPGRMGAAAAWCFDLRGHAGLAKR